MPSKYLALTVAPVLKTILNARRTRELWASSYLFSYLMKKILGELRKNEKREFILPFVGDEKYFLDFENQKDEKLKKGAGLFPDRIIFKSSGENDYAETLEIARIEIENFAKLTAKSINKETELETVKNYFFDFFQLYLLEINVPEKENPVLFISPYLEAIECQKNFPQKDLGYIEKLMDWSPGSFLAEEAFGKKRKSFPTLLEVAAMDFKTHEIYENLQKNRLGKSPENLKSQEKEDEETLFKTLEQAKDNGFRTPHKYIAVVHADGDGIGALLQKLTGSQFGEFSKLLKKFALDAVEEIDNYGGTPIYAGGDDLLFFAPVIHHSDNIIMLLERLNQLIQTTFEGWLPLPKLSFGLSISYYKFPLYEALEKSRDLLFEVAKKTEKKNAVALEIRKHSGQTFGATLHLDSPTNDLFRQILKENMEKQERVLSSINYHIKENENAYHIIGKDKIQVENFLKNCFDEEIHGDKEFEKYIKQVKGLVPVVFHEEADSKKAIGKIYGLLRTAAFLTSKN